MIIGLAIFLFVHLYQLFNLVSTTVTKSLPQLIVICPALALAGAYLTVKFLAESKSYGCGCDVVIESYHRRNGYMSARDTLCKTQLPR